MSLKLSLRHGAVSSLNPMPFGWIITINNDPSWITTLTGQAVVGAAALDSSSLSGLLSIKPEPGFTCSTMLVDGPPHLRVGLYVPDRDTHYDVPTRALRIVNDP